MISGKSQENGGSYYNSSYINVSKHNNNILHLFGSVLNFNIVLTLTSYSYISSLKTRGAPGVPK